MRSFRLRLGLTDAVVVTGSVVAVVALLTSFSDQALPLLPTLLPLPSLDWVLPAGVIALWMAFLAVQRTTDTRVLGVGAAEYRRVVNASILCFGFVAIACMTIGLAVPREYFLVAFPVGTLTLVAGRWSWRQWLSDQRQAGRFLSRALVAGARADVEYVVQQIAAGRPNYNIVGTVFDGGAGGHITDGRRDIPIIGDLRTVSPAARALAVDVVIVAGQPVGKHDFIRDLAWDLEGSATELILASQLTNVAGPRIHIRPVEGLPLMHVELPQYDGGRHVMKRIFDIVLSSFALVLIAPVLLVLMLLVRLDSPGGAVFRQERVGRDGRRFTLYKLRSMVDGADRDTAILGSPNDGAGALFKLRDDPRVTRLGRFLRRYSLDELPQFWNVLLGDMSLVGPRPPLPSEVATYEGHVHRRLYIKPGLTGMWQINGRSNLSWEDSVRLDLYYVENWSLAGDIVILWRTFKVLIRPDGSY